MVNLLSLDVSIKVKSDGIDYDMIVQLIEELGDPETGSPPGGGGWHFFLFIRPLIH